VFHLPTQVLLMFGSV